MRSFMKCHNRVLAAGLALFCTVKAAGAAVIVDQQWTGPFDVDSVNGALYRAQVFTVGVSGVLTRFEVAMTTASSGTTSFELWDAPGGVPSTIPGVPLASVVLSFTGTGFVGADIAGLNVTAGDTLALVQIGGTSAGSGAWQGSVGGQYAGGSFYSTTSGGGTVWLELNQDAGFRTFTRMAVPVPNTVTLMGLGIAVALSRRRRESRVS